MTSNIRKPVTDPLGRSNKKLPPLPGVTSSGTMGSSLPSESSAPSEGNTTTPQAPNSALPTPPNRGGVFLPPLPGANRQAVPTVPPKVEATEELEPEEEPMSLSDTFEEEEIDNPYAIDPIYLDEEYTTEDDDLISEDDEILIQRISYATDFNIQEPTIHALLSNDEIELEVVEAIASNPATPQDLLEVLATYDDEFVRQAVMENPSISDELYASFVDDEELMIVAAMVSNPRTDRDILLTLMDHEDPYILFLLQESTLLTEEEKSRLS